VRTAVAADAPDPRQEVAQMLANWLAVRVTRELAAERMRREYLARRRADQLRRDVGYA
jgi:hypothetical protein